jgi:hypothetical protein
MNTTCPVCAADWSNGATCEDNFHQFLYWEHEDIENLGVVHHLMVLSYYLQHPQLYSPEGLDHGKGLLVDFVARGITPQQVRQRDRDKVDSGKRQFKIKGTTEAQGAYTQPVIWTMHTTDVVAGGAKGYVANVRAWAASIYDSLKASGNLPVTT